MGSKAGSRGSQKVPQCIGTITRAPTSWAAWTVPSGSRCMVCMNQRGAYAPMGTIATSIRGYRRADLDEDGAVGAVVRVIDPRTTCHG
jgi:hypothetical protein